MYSRVFSFDLPSTEQCSWAEEGRGHPGSVPGGLYCSLEPVAMVNIF